LRDGFHDEDSIDKTDDASKRGRAARDAGADFEASRDFKRNPGASSRQAMASHNVASPTNGLTGRQGP
jgi:hypothetical protein